MLSKHHIRLKNKHEKVEANVESARCGTSLPGSNEVLETVTEYVYLGQVRAADPNHEREITRRISIGWAAFGKHSEILNGKLPLSLKKLVFSQSILPVRTYGDETWCLP